MVRLSSRIACVTNLANHGILCDNSTDMGINLTQMSIIMESPSRTKYQYAVPAIAKIVPCKENYSADSRMYFSTFWGEDVYSCMSVVAPRMPERLRIVALLATTFNRVLDFSWQKHDDNRQGH